MAIAIDQVTQFSGTSNTSWSFNHTMTGGLSDTCLVFFFQSHANTPATSALSTVSYNGVALTKLIRENDGTRNASVEIWALSNPASGTNSVSITAANTLTNPDFAAVGYSGVDSSVWDTAGVGTVVATGSTSISQAITTVTANAVTVDVVDSGGSATKAATAGQTVDVNITDSNGDGFGVSHKLISSPGSVTLSWSFSPSTSGAAAIAVGALKPAASTTGSETLMMTGCGA